MPRPERRIAEGGLSHVNNRLGRSERALDRMREADAVVDLLQCAVQRDGLTVFAWCLSSNHHHLWGCAASTLRCGSDDKSTKACPAPFLVSFAAVLNGSLWYLNR